MGLMFWYSQNIMHQHVVLRLPSGFFPKVVHMEKNDSLRFVNLSTRPSWPAAGPHPTHTSYPDFDAKEGIPPGYAWTFTFAEEGTYTFHDHFAPEMSGIAVAGKIDISQASDQETCTNLPDPHAQAGCMEIYFKNITDTEPFKEANTIFEDIAARYPGSCHTFAHDLGKNAYLAYMNNTLPDDIGQGASSCGYGFWHGFTTAMQTHRGIDAAKEFCASLGGGTDAQMGVNRMNCYHGIGIGLIPDPPPQQLWGEFQTLIDPALAFCDTIISDNPFFKERCLTGVFHAMTVYMQTEQYGFTFDEDSLSYCAKQAVEHQSTCFNTLVAALPQFTNFDLERTVAILKESTPASLLSEIFTYAAIIFVDAEASAQEAGDFVLECDALDPNFRPLCILAAINKLYNNGVPGIEYIKAVEFCSGDWIETGEKENCFHQVASYSAQVYKAEKMPEVCNTIRNVYTLPVARC
jgi:hypothetical protein